MNVSRPVLSLSLSLGLALVSLLAACSDGGSGGGAAPGSCTSDSECNNGYTCQFQSVPGATPPGTSLTDCDPFEDPFCEPGGEGEGGSFPGPPGAGGSFPGPGAEGGSSSEGEGGSSPAPPGAGGSGLAGTRSSGQGAGGGQAATGKCVAVTGAGGNGNSTGGNNGTGNNGSGNTSSQGGHPGSQGGNPGSQGGNPGSQGGNPGSCNGDFSLGKNAVVQGDLTTWGKACNGAAPTNCPDGYFANIGASCVCLVACGSLNGNPKPGDACVSNDGVCAKVLANNGNTATLCVPTSLNLCTDGAGGPGQGGGGSPGEGGSAGQGQSGSDNPPQCKESGSSCEDESECCSGTCSFEECF